jgi:hypothetical protein
MVPGWLQGRYSAREWGSAARLEALSAAPSGAASAGGLSLSALKYLSALGACRVDVRVKSPAFRSSRHPGPPYAEATLAAASAQLINPLTQNPARGWRAGGAGRRPGAVQRAAKRSAKRRQLLQAMTCQPRSGY